VAYSDAEAHRRQVEESFQYHLGLDLSYMRRHHPDHFTAPHNVARAICLYHYFRPSHRFFEDRDWEMIARAALPERAPDSSGPAHRLWIDYQPRLFTTPDAGVA
jgi:hypothetical protein